MTSSQKIILKAAMVFFGIPLLASADGVSFKPEQIDFHRVQVDTCSPKKITATNNTGSAIENPDFMVKGERVFRVQSGFRKCKNPLPPGKSCRVYVDFCPEFNQDYSAFLYFSGSNIPIQMTGSGNSGRF